MGTSPFHTVVDSGESSTDRAKGAECLYNTSTPGGAYRAASFGSGVANRGEPGSRVGGYPLKRIPTGTRQTFLWDKGRASSPQTDNSFSMNGHGNPMETTSDCRAYTPRFTKGDVLDCFPAKGKYVVYKILIVIVAACFLAEAFLQGSILMLLKQTDLVSGAFEDTSTHYSNSRPGAGSEKLQQIAELPCKLYNSVEDLEASHQRGSFNELRKYQQFDLRRPRLAMVSLPLDLRADNLFLITLAKAFLVLGYDIELYAVKNGSLWTSWRKLGVFIQLLQPDIQHAPVDWSRYEGVIVSSFSFSVVLSSLMQEPFKFLPVVWILQDDTLARHLKDDLDPEVKHLVSQWRRAFSRANFVTFPNQILPEKYSHFDAGNFVVIPGSPLEAWEAERYMTTNQRSEVRAHFGVAAEDFVIAVVGSHCNPRELWKEHALIMHAAVKVLARPYPSEDMIKYKGLRMFILDQGDYGQSYDLALQAMAHHLGLKDGSVHLVSMDLDLSGILWMSDVVVYGSLEEEKSFPPILVRAMCLERPIIAPSFTIIKQNIAGDLLFPAGDDESLCESLLRLRQTTSEELSSIIRTDKSWAKNLLSMDAVLGHSRLLEISLDFPSQVLLPQPVLEVLDSFKSWQWDLLTNDSDISGVIPVRVLPSDPLTTEENVELELLNKFRTQGVEISTTPPFLTEMSFEVVDGEEWDGDRAAESRDEIERMEEEELEERKEQSQATFEDVNRGVKKAEREKDEIHERDDAELERIGQPLCIYESYQGSGAWPFLHQGIPLYRGVSLSSHGRRPKFDDIDASSRLPLLNDTYYRDILCDFGAFLAIANRLDRIHKNLWIGFQPWYAAGTKVALSRTAESSLLEAVAKRKDGDSVYFWAQLGADGGIKPQNISFKPIEDFWSICDALNAGNCRLVFLEAFKQLYGLPSSWNELPPMPAGGGIWAGMHCWAMPTSSYMEFVMFSRLFLDALDSQHYEEHHDNKTCCLGTSKVEVRHCYCHLLEVLVNVWAYHSARRMFYLDPLAGLTQEQHSLKSRRGNLWIKWFTLSTLKSIDEEYAERADYELPEQRWLWPHTGEVFWQGILERERQEQYVLKMEKKRRNKERLARMRSRYKQKSLGRYVKPQPGAGYIPQDSEDVSSEPDQHFQIATE